MKTQEARRIIHDLERRRAGEVNLLHFYTAVTPVDGGEAQFDVYAARREYGRGGAILVKHVERFRTDRSTFRARDIYLNSMGGYHVDFSDMTRRCRHYAECYYTNPEKVLGVWGTEKYEGLRTKFMLDGTLINDYSGTKYEHCGLETSNVHPMVFAECYRISKSVEFLVKAHLTQFITPSFVRRLRDNRRLFNLFRSNIDEIRNRWHGIRVLNYALANDCSLAEARSRTVAADFFNPRKIGCHYKPLPNSVDRYALYKWCSKRDIDGCDYLRYADMIRDLGEDITAFGVTMPRDFAAAREDAERRLHELHERERRERLRAERRERRERNRIDRMTSRELSAQIKGVAAMFAMMEGVERDGYCVTFPKSVKDLVREGNAMRNCIGRMGYDRKIVGRKSVIVFLRSSGGDVDVEIGINGDKMFVAQCYAKCNSKPPEKARKFAEDIAARCQTVYRKAA